MSVVSWDLETESFGPSNLAPEPICVSYADEEGNNLLVASCEPEFDEIIALCLGQDLQVNANIAFDMAVILAHRPALRQRVWDAYRRDGVTDILIREKLLVLADTGDLEYMTLQNGAKQKLGWSQADLEIRYLGVDRKSEKDDEDGWRKNYVALKGIKASGYPDEAKAYALLDAKNALEIFHKQEEKGREWLKPQFLNTRAALALYLSSCWGFPIDQPMVEKLYAELSARYSDDALVERDGKTVLAYQHLLDRKILRPSEPPRPHANQVAKGLKHLRREAPPVSWEPFRNQLEEAGIKFTAGKPSSNNETLLRQHVAEICLVAGIQPKLTETGLVAINDEQMQELKGLDEAIDEYIEREELAKLVTTELPRMRAPRVHPRYDILKKTGRTSSYGNSKRDKNPAYPAVNIQQIDPRVREAYTASPGHVLCSIDYDFIELVSVAQKCLTLFGRSVLADRINAGYDPHAFLASRIILKFDPTYKGSLDVEENYQVFEALEKTDEPKYKHFRTLAKPTGLGFPGGLGAIRFIGYAKSTFGVDIVKLAGSQEAAVEMARDLKAEWLRTYPEMEAFFRWVTSDCLDLDWSSQGDERYCYQSPFGMVRRNCLYTEATNGASLQTPTAEGAKIALWDLASAMYDASLNSCLLGCHMLAFIHDEVLVELPLDDLTHERAFEAARIMREGMRKVMTDVRVGADPALMFRWNKGAKTVLGPDGRLRVWEPKKAP